MFPFMGGLRGGNRSGDLKPLETAERCLEASWGDAQPAGFSCPGSRLRT